MKKQSVREIIHNASSLDCKDDRFIFYCEARLMGGRRRFPVSKDALELVHPNLPELITYLYKALSINAADSVRLTVSHWDNPELPVRLSGNEYRSHPYEVVPAKRLKNCWSLTSDFYTLCTLPSGLQFASARSIESESLQSSQWLDTKYPGSVKKLEHLLGLGGFTPREMASLAFAPDVVVDPTVSFEKIEFS